MGHAAASGVNPFEPKAPVSGLDISQALESQHEQLRRALEELPIEEFVAPQALKWSPADHARHLHKSARPLVQALTAPRIVLWWRFGTRGGASGTYADVREAYRARLAKGYGANRFAPSAVDIPNDALAWRSEILDGWTATVRALSAAARRWRERALDRYQVPHPLLGKLSMREILFFTLYHNAHHLQLVAERRASGQVPA